MPWHVSKTAQCPASKPWGVIKDSTGNVVPGGCHPTKGEAESHMAALYANEPGAKMSTALITRDAHVAMQRAQALGGNRGAIPNGQARSQGFRGAIMRAKLTTRGSQEFYEVEGYASVVDTPYEMFDMWGPYEEEIRAGAFDTSLARDDLDVAFLVNHRGVTMARTKNGTLSLWADSTGLGSRAYLNATRQDVRDIVSAIDDGLIDEMSFAFYLLAGGWNESYDKFTIYEADVHRGDVSAVNYGANPYTSISARQAEILAELDKLPLGAARAALARLAARPDIGTPEIVPSVPVEIGRGGQVIDDDERASGGNPADATHGSYNGAHTHMHAANGAQGSDEMHTHAHSHNGDGSHSHGHANSIEPDVQLDDQAPGAVESGMSTEFAAQLLMLDDDHERDRDNP